MEHDEQRVLLPASLFYFEEDPGNGVVLMNSHVLFNSLVFNNN